MKSRLILMLLVCLPSVVLDQLTKSLATTYLMGRPGLSFFGNIVRLQYALNPGAWGGIGEKLPEATRKIVFTVGVGIFLAALAWYILKHAHPMLVSLGLSLILSGGLGNLVDRALYGHVVDFMYIGVDAISWMHTNIFNVADMAIMAGGAMLLIHALWPQATGSKTNPAAGQNPTA